MSEAEPLMGGEDFSFYCLKVGLMSSYTPDSVQIVKPMG